MIFTITNTINIDVNEIYDDWEEHSFDGQALNSCIEQAMDYNLDDMEIDTKEIIDLETNELEVELLSSEEIENMYKEDKNNANSI